MWYNLKEEKKNDEGLRYLSTDIGVTKGREPTQEHTEWVLGDPG